MAQVLRPEPRLYRRNAARVTTCEVLHEMEKQDLVAKLPMLRRKKGAAALQAEWDGSERAALAEAGAVVADYRHGAEVLLAALRSLADLKAPELLGKAEGEVQRVEAVLTTLHEASEALARKDFGAAGSAVDEAARALFLVGGPLVVSLNTALGQAAVGPDLRGRLEANLAERRVAKLGLGSSRTGTPAEIARAEVAVCALEAAGFALAAEILGSQGPRKGRASRRTAKVGRDNALRVVPPQELETFADVGGMEDVKAALRATVGAILERPDQAARYQVVHNGVLFHGPPGTGKTLLSRALAGEYGMRYIRFSPASIASAYIHEAAANLQRLFELARQSTPCVLFLDEVDTIASNRGDQPSADHREVVTQLMNCLEEYRTVPGLVICAATNDLDRLDTGLREGRFDAKILVPLPDAIARADVLRVHLERRGESVDWDGVDLDELVRRTAGRNAAALEGFVSRAAQAALQENAPIGHAHLLAAVGEREGKDRVSLEEKLSWDDVVLADDTREQLVEILNVFEHPDFARSLGVKPPPGVLLHGPPGTGKTMIAKVMANALAASFYEQSAADLLSKWVGESEQKVAKLFEKARANRPTVVFIDEIDGLLRRRSANAGAPWEERVVGQFLRELDGLVAGEGVLLVGATNRLDIIDDAIVRRRMTPIEVGLPDAAGRLALLELLCRDVSIAKDVNLRTVAKSTDGMSGADLKQVRDLAGMKALNRASRGAGAAQGAPAITMADFKAALAGQRGRSSLAHV